jgi:hypothetical protein
MVTPNKATLGFLLLAFLALLAALWAGLLRLGWMLPTLTPDLAFLHGPLMVSGFLGTLITLERVVALKQRWMYAAPFLTGLGWIATLLLSERSFGPLLLTLGSLGGASIVAVIARRDPGTHSFTMLLGMLAWFVGNALWLSGLAIYQVVYWWQAFLVLTILGERLELNRVLAPASSQGWLFGALVVLFLAGVMARALNVGGGAFLIGAAMLGLALWSLRNDIAWRNLRHKLPLTRYIAWCLAPGFVWLGAAGVLNMAYGAQSAGPLYDAVLHSVFIGFVISMIFGHAPIIFPAIVGTPVTFQPSFYVQLGLLHLSLLLRITGDLSGWSSGRAWGGLLNEVAILLFLATTMYVVRGGRRKP